MSDTDISKCTAQPWTMSDDGLVCGTEYAHDGRKVGPSFDIFDGGDAPNEGLEDEWMANAKLIARAPTMAAELDRQRALVAQMREAMQGKSPDWADKLWEFLLAEYEAIPTSGEAVTSDVRPHFDALCEFMAARDAALAASEATDNG